ncbi:MAG: ABC transporter permease [Flavisolibacter sp.]|nr:ABC transporter permease [Flavisolibacter sp.]
MLKNFLTALSRQLWRNRLFTGLNILGLSVCLCIAWVIFRIVNYEYSFDKKIPDAENIYQVVSKSKSAEAPSGGNAGVPNPVFETLKKEVPGTALVVPMFYKHVHSATLKDAKTGVDKRVETPDGDILQVATTFDYFKMLGYQWLAGDPATALDGQDKVVLTNEKAQEYFPSAALKDIVGKTVAYDDTVFRQVSAIVAQLPYLNSFSKSNNEFIALSKDDLTGYGWGGWSSDNLVFIKPYKNAAPQKIMSVLNAINTEHNKTDFGKYKYKTWFEVIPLKDKHFQEQFGAQTRTASKKILNGLMIVGVFLLLLSCINYINLSTALLPQRAKEIGIRKTLGSSARSLIVRFISETFIVTFLAALLSLFLTWLAVKLFADFLPDGLDNYINYMGMILFMLALIFIVSLVAGLYPAWVSSRIKTINVLKGSTEAVIGRDRFSLRKALIVFQFFVAQLFIIGAIIIGQQLKYVLNTNPGFNKEAVVTLNIPYYLRKDPKFKDKQFLLKNELQHNSALAAVSLGNRPMDNNMIGQGFTYYGSKEPLQTTIHIKYGDVDYLKFYGFHLLAGRNFYASDTMRELVINEKAMQFFGFKTPEEAIGKMLSHTGDSSGGSPIVGVISDFHQFGFQSKIVPTLLTTSKEQMGTLNVRLLPGKWKEGIATIEKEWKQLYTGIPFNYKFYDETIKKLYDREERMQTLVRTATGIAIFISCLGLFGLATLTAFQRTKEVGIRKVLGASVSGIVALLSRQFVLLVLLSVLLASPVALWLMKKWLQDFAFRINIEWWMFLVAAMGAMVIALLTVSYQAVKAARANPVQSLRNE